MASVVIRHRAAVKPPLAVLVWSVAAVSVAGFAAAWVLAARNRDLLDLSADFGPDRLLAAFPIVGAVLASRRRSNPIGWSCSAWAWCRRAVHWPGSTRWTR